ncbi:biopolymer transporter ExbD [Porticoccus sp. W117]|uniref:ExbD/TolR family protein n=1 Tax=Porticoccus sp. W117 TaxID=3054777 RepID=UPI00259A278F|nr:biopolymer transporter ExbD [Porticoccus sp. W117]MDM3872301.1 biopolymer transporter ExbD [Porticoccus sp. W117]
MRERTRKADAQGQSIDLTPMLDVVFIMLIFFIVTASFIKTPGQEIDKVETVTARLKPTSVLVSVNANNQVHIDKKPVEDNDLKPTIKRLFLENPKGNVVIQVDAKSTLEAVGKVYDAAKDAGVAGVIIATSKGE